MRIADCESCGAGIGFRNQTQCHRCRAADREAAKRAPCPSCGKLLLLRVETGRCIRCSRTCVECGHILRYKTSTRCLDCRRRFEAAATKSQCPRCEKPGFIRTATGWCGPCSRPPNPPLDPRPCAQCGQLARKLGDGLCNRCWTRSPTRPVTQAENLMSSAPNAPDWLIRFAEFATERHCVARSCLMVSAIGRMLAEPESSHPQSLLERSRLQGRSAGALARTLEEFLVAEGLAFGLDQEARLARGRRQRRVDAVPEVLRFQVAAFGDFLVRSQERARRAGTHPRADVTIEQSLSVVRDLARFLVDERAKSDWSAVEVADVEAFLGHQPTNLRRRLTASAQFFRWAKKNKVILVDPTRDLPGIRRRGFIGRTLTVGEQRRLFRRWSDNTSVHPHEAFVGMLALIHAASSGELSEADQETVSQVIDAVLAKSRLKTLVGGLA